MPKSFPAFSKTLVHWSQIYEAFSSTWAQILRRRKLKSYEKFVLTYAMVYLLEYSSFEKQMRKISILHQIDSSSMTKTQKGSQFFALIHCNSHVNHGHFFALKSLSSEIITGKVFGFAK